MPDLIVVRSSNTTYGSGVSTYYSENRYFDYSFDQHDLDTAVTKGFHMINVIASLTERDSAKTVMAFEKNYHIDYPGFVGAADVVKSYHVSGFPTFYFIDKEGKIANVFLGSADNFEEKVTSILDNLINK